MAGIPPYPYPTMEPRLDPSLFYEDKPSDPNYFLSIHYPATVTDAGIEYFSAAQYMYATMLRETNKLDLLEALMAAKTPAQVRLHGYIRSHFKDKMGKPSSTSEDVCLFPLKMLCYMTAAQYLKFSQNPELRAKLLATEFQELILHDPNEYFMGINRSPDMAKVIPRRFWLGINGAGKQLMAARALLTAEEMGRCEMGEAFAHLFLCKFQLPPIEVADYRIGTGLRLPYSIPSLPIKKSILEP